MLLFSANEWVHAGWYEQEKDVLQQVPVVGSASQVKLTIEDVQNEESTAAFERFTVTLVGHQGKYKGINIDWIYMFGHTGESWNYAGNIPASNGEYDNPLCTLSIRGDYMVPGTESFNGQGGIWGVAYASNEDPLAGLR